MRFFKQLSIASLIILLSITGCKDPKEDPAPNNVNRGESSFDGNNYHMTSGLIENFGTDSNPSSGLNFEGNWMDLRIISEGLHFTQGSGKKYLEGTGFALYLEMFSSSDNGIAPGDYTLNHENFVPTGYYHYGEVQVLINGQFIHYSNLYSGTAKVTRNGGEYEISFEGLNIDKKPITVYYKGELDFIDYTTN
ncbi:hypothetical protein [Mangrovivirga cuniculi]|uniref:Uncharacterized protein n=1 Tax=Mangrovivirga cuniculi TaxID=2715131 RepID=A0A4D7JPQ5_9BACT|nr:hypothetical protein [Mangrovivirga cuniculi]QCK15470.1 hypothetical protein DCC35_12310 [Mangrovivirga cuniculi]